MAAQVAHGVLECYKKALKEKPEFVSNWESYSGSAKIVLQVKSLKEIKELEQAAVSIGVPYAVITDAGRTEIEPGSITVIAVGPAPEDAVNKITGKLELYN
eukprot:CAMPEP_0170527938 /NCGR_PEP_ID=MMETSP0209-20121228/13435_1 /TAXON_ID=665100 ORGANISM="Litonotus pictus, Strain P1" /NCGR_SAMPLE_ID=MMETSP0209 /ASSEMBLY_ACC=CAM_ASM_000301 /LENGTH=100 /DNA_ID=CAMNT_0010818833 /DNA_START=314 /DNA_END=616 /DNA_ORIENTATION=+